jgi:hypothetical protein
MAQKMPLLSVLQDTAVMDDLRNDNETLQAARSSPGAESLDVLLDGNESGVRDGGYTQTEAIILNFASDFVASISVLPSHKRRSRASSLSRRAATFGRISRSCGSIILQARCRTR